MGQITTLLVIGTITIKTFSAKPLWKKQTPLNHKDISTDYIKVKSHKIIQKLNSTHSTYVNIYINFCVIFIIFCWFKDFWYDKLTATIITKTF